MMRDVLIVSRANIQISSLPTATLGIVLASRDWSDLFQWPILFFVLLFFIVLSYSCQINCLKDIAVDEKSKADLSRAVQAIGIRKLKTIMTMELVLAGFLVIGLCLVRKNLLLALGFLGAVFGYIYSAPPLRIKKRGLLSPLPVIIGLYFFPLPAGWFVVTNEISLFIILFGIGYALIMQGITFINTCEDYQEDRAEGISTIAHVLGIRKTLGLGAMFVLAGGLMDLSLIWAHQVQRLPGGILRFVGLLAFSFVFLGAIGLISNSMFAISRAQNPMAVIKTHAGRMRQWFLVTRYPLLLMSLLRLY